MIKIKKIEQKTPIKNVSKVENAKKGCHTKNNAFVSTKFLNQAALYLAQI